MDENDEKSVKQETEQKSSTELEIPNQTKNPFSVVTPTAAQTPITAIAAAAAAAPNQRSSSPPQKQPFRKRSKPFAPNASTQSTTDMSLSMSPNGVAEQANQPEEDKDNVVNDNRLLNPLNRLNQLQSKQSKRNQRKRRQRNAKKILTIQIESSPDEQSSDDDCIILPTEPNPIFSIESSDESGNELNKSCENSNIPTITGNRLASPTFSNMSDDFFASPDFDEMTRSNLIDPDDDMYIPRFINFVSAKDHPTTTTTTSTTISSTNTSTDVTINGTVNQSEESINNETIFAKPSQTAQHHHHHPQPQTKSYEVHENSISAVDIYESESSDMPESIYSKGQSLPECANRKDDQNDTSHSESNEEELIINTTNRSKRLKKRRTSSGNRSSEQIQSDTDEDDDNDRIPMQFNNKMSNTSTPFIVRGEAVTNAMTDIQRKSLPPRKPTKSFDVVSDEEFMSMLSIIVHEDKSVNNENELKSNEEKRVNEVSEKHSDWVVTDLTKPNETIDKTSDESDELITEIADVEGDEKTNESNEIINVESFDNTNYEIIQNAKNDSNVDHVTNVDASSGSLIVHPEMSWNDEMKYFYCNSWGGETFNVKAIQSMQTRNPSEWTICEKDEYSQRRYGDRCKRVPRCFKCNEYGHKAIQCRTGPRQIACYMCGERGHKETRCPKAMCLGCGSDSKLFVGKCRRCDNTKSIFCGLCRLYGHAAKHCPDKWRRYHSTIRANEPLTKQLPLNKMPISRDKKTMYCCVCASKGHTAEYCRSPYRMSDMILAPLKIHSYEQSYERSELNTNTSVPEYALVSVPQKDFEFNWDVDERNTNRFYGRFLKATNYKRPVSMNNVSATSMKRTHAEMDDENDVDGDDGRDKDAPKEKKCLLLNPFSVEAKQLSNINKCNNAMEVQVSEEEMKEVEEAEMNNIEMNDGKDKDSKVSSSEAPLPEVDSKTLPTEEKPIENVPNKDVEESTECNMDKKTIQQDRTISCSSDIEFCFVTALQDLNPIAYQQKEETVPMETIILPATAIHNESMESKMNFSFSKAFNELDKNLKNIEKSSTKTFDLSHIGQMPAPVPAKKMPASQEPLPYAEKPKPKNYLYPPCILRKDVPEYCAPPKWTAPLVPIPPPPPKTIAGKEEIFKITTAEEPIIRFDDAERMPDYISLTTTTTQSTPIKSTNPFNKYGKSSDGPTGDNDKRTTTLDASPLVPIQPPINIPTDNDPCNAKIFLSNDHQKILLNPKGTEFLRSETAKNNINVTMEYGSYGNILNVFGRPNDQEQFHNSLQKYLDEAEEAARMKSEVSSRVPKNRTVLIKFIQNQILQLDKSLGNVKDLFCKMRMGERMNTKQGRKNADAARKMLNMILMGQAGLADGQTHLVALLGNLRYLRDSSCKENVSINFRHQVFLHCRYIFSSFDHKNYPNMISDYEERRKLNQLPSLDLDRSLLGMKLDVAMNDDANPQPSTSISDNNNDEDDDVDDDDDDATDTTDTMSTDIQLNIKSSQAIDLTEEEYLEKKKNFDNAKSKLRLTNVFIDTNPSTSSASTNYPSFEDIECEQICKNILATISIPAKSIATESKQPSIFWSRKCLQLCEKCQKTDRIQNNPQIREKLEFIIEKASNNMLSYKDYINILQLVNLLKKT